MLAAAAAMRTRTLAALCLSAAVYGCGGSSPSGPSDGEDARVLQGRAVSAIDGSGAQAVSVSAGATSATTDTDGNFRLDVAGPATHRLALRGATIFDRETSVTGPGSTPARVSLIPSTFDIESFNEMFRTNGSLQRWTSRPSVVVFSRVMTYVSGQHDEYAASSESLSDDEVSQLVAHLKEGLTILTAGTFNDFAAVEIERPAAGSYASINRAGKIVVGRYNGIVSLGNTIGFGQYGLVFDGSVGGGAMLLDAQFDRNDNRRRLLRIHELGHALGLMHVTGRPSIMNPSIGADVTDFDRASATIAFQRPVGNYAPDIDPTATVISRSTRSSIVWAAPVPCRR